MAQPLSTYSMCANSLTTSPMTAGVEAQPLPVDHNDTLVYFGQTNITLVGAQVVDINADSFNDIVLFESCSFVNITNFTSYGCQVENQILEAQNTSNLYIQGSSFRDTPARGLSITDSVSELDSNIFEHLGCPTSGAGGGGLWVSNSNGAWVSITRSNFSNNSANNQYGGAIYVQGSDCYFEDNRFVNNTSGVNGGAVLVALVNQDDASCNSQSCLFVNNTAGFNGVVYAYPTAGSISLSNCIFSGNLGYQGGAVSLWQVGIGLVDSCKFEQNAVRYNGGNPGDGSALYVDGYSSLTTSLYILNSSFSRNDGSSSPASAVVHAIRCQCIGILNSTLEDSLGIAITIDETSGNCANNQLLFPPLFNLSTVAGDRDNYLDQYSAHNILGSSLSVDIRNTSFSGNVDSTFLQPIDTKAVAVTLRGGAAVSILSTQRILLLDLKFDRNKARQGGAVLLDSCLAAILWFNTFTNNLATQGGGAIASVHNEHSGGLFIGNTSYMGNSALTGGALYGTDEATITISNSTTFDSNGASFSGGAITCVSCELLTLQAQVSMTLNRAGAYGGALYAESSTAIQSIDVHYSDNQ